MKRQAVEEGLHRRTNFCDFPSMVLFVTILQLTLCSGATKNLCVPQYCHAFLFLGEHPAILQWPVRLALWTKVTGPDTIL